MNCREVQSELFAANEGTPANPRRAEVEAHVANCAACRRVHEDLTGALAAWRSDVSKIAVPDAELEWHAVRRRIRGGGGEPSVRSRHNWMSWLGLPLATAAAVVLVMVAPASQSPDLDIPVGEVARAENIEAPGNNASTMVFVDDKSGWLIVWASDATSQTGEG